MELIQQENIENKISNIHGLQVMLDKDLAELYGVEIHDKVLIYKIY